MRKMIQYKINIGIQYFSIRYYSIYFFGNIISGICLKIFA